MRAMRAQAGFTLLEVAVALAILGMGVVTCLQIFGRSLRLEETASRQTRAVLAARVRMDGLLARALLVDGSGCDDVTMEGFKPCWRVWRAYDEAGIDPDTAGESGFEPFGLEVTVTWREGSGAKTYTLRSLTFAEVDE